MEGKHIQVHTAWHNFGIGLPICVSVCVVCVGKKRWEMIQQPSCLSSRVLLLAFEPLQPGKGKKPVQASRLACSLREGVREGLSFDSAGL